MVPQAVVISSVRLLGTLHTAHHRSEASRQGWEERLRVSHDDSRACGTCECTRMLEHRPRYTAVRIRIASADTGLEVHKKKLPSTHADRASVY